MQRQPIPGFDRRQICSAGEKDLYRTAAGFRGDGRNVYRTAGVWGVVGAAQNHQSPGLPLTPPGQHTDGALRTDVGDWRAA